jgi:hypothetical protein
MSIQIFKEQVPITILDSFIKSLCEIINDYYVINPIAYKKAVFHGTLSQFLDKVKPYYHQSKQYYVTRKMTYTRFLTIIRQICNQHNLPFASKVQYKNSTYEIVYYIQL